MPQSRTDHRNRNPFLQGRGRPTVACHIRGQRSLQFQYSGYLVEAFVVYPQCTSVISAGMGHASEKVTYIYLASFDNKTLSNANKKVIAAVRFKKEEEE